MKQASTKEKEQKRQAVRGVVLFAALQLLCAVAFWSMTGIPDLPGWCEKLFWGLAVFCIALLIPAAGDPSFPSGHTIASFEAATVLMLYNKKWGIPAMLLAAAIGFSRLYLYIHYPTDVLCSVVLGVAIGLLAYGLTDRAEEYCLRKKHA